MSEQPAAGRAWTVRQRLLVMMVGLMALGLLGTGLLSFAVQYGSLTDRVDAELRQEVQEVAEVARSGPGRDGVPFTRVDDLFRSFLTTSVASDDEAFLGMVEGEVRFRSGGERPFEANHPDVVDAVLALDVPDGQARTTTIRSQGTRLRLIVADVQLEGETREAEFVVVNDIGRQRAEIDRRLLQYLGLSMIVLIGSGALGYVVLGRLLRPLTELQEATAQISTDDLSRRVDVASGTNTDIAQLAMRFNEMLDRIEVGVKDQRQFLDDAAHELRTPLTILRGNTELLAPDDPEEVAATRVLLLDEVDRMQRLVDDLLVLARAQRHDFVRPGPSDVTELAVECMERITALGDRRWRLSANAEGELSLDRQRVIQAVVQLAANAVKFSEEDSVVEIFTRWVDGSSDEAGTAQDLGASPAPRYLAVTVIDQGVGIPEHQVARVFDRFTRADNAAQVDGSGLGLPIVSAIAAGHRGAAGVESLEGVGSRFTLWLPDLADDGAAGSK